ncbi:MAG: cation diffusion facilitator family transporter [Actinomycetota bacterium]|nr:cation diffusion facilitator family transporter [Actinomycetota bacterium]MDQ3709558.1 cation diffusion facilitator family transporter [Actinomycetota bacterium]
MTLGFFVVELVTALVTNSLALLSDAGHMLTDVVGHGMAFAAIQAGAGGRHGAQRSFGLYRLEILAALANAVLLLGVAAYVVYEAARRLQDPPEVVATGMLVVAVLGLVVNVVALLLLRTGAGESLNVHGAYLEVVADALGSVGVIVAALILATTGWAYADPLIAAGIGLFIVPRSVRIARQAVRILVQAAPPHIRVDDVRGDLAGIEGVTDAHDVHVWTLTSDMEVASAHLMVHASADTHGVLDAARAVLAERYDIDHATVQVEPDTHRGCEEIAW